MDRRLDMTGSSCAYIPYKGYEWAVRAGFQSAPLGGCSLESVKLLMGPDPRTVPGKKVTEKQYNYWRFFKPRNQVRTLAVGGGHGTFYGPVRAKTYFDTHPERVNYTAYSIYGHDGPPKGVTLDPRMGCAFAIHGRCYGHRLDDTNCPLNVNRYQWLKDWMKVVSLGYAHEYGNCSHNFYTAYERICAHDLKLYAKLGINGWMEEMCFTDSTPPPRFPKDPELVRRRSEKSPSNWQWLYVVSRLTWDPSLDVDAILDELRASTTARRIRR